MRIQKQHHKKKRTISQVGNGLSKASSFSIISSQREAGMPQARVTPGASVEALFRDVQVSAYHPTIGAQQSLQHALL